MKTYGRVVTTILVSLLVFSVLVVLASFAGFMGAGLMDLTAVVALLCWGTFLVLTLLALRRAQGVVQGERRQLGPSFTWTSGLSFAAFWLSLGTAFLLGLGAFATCGPVWLSAFYHWGGLLGSVLGLTAWFALPRLTHGTLEAAGEHVSPHRWRTLGILGGAVYGFWGLVWLVAWLLLRGSIDAAAYPNSASSPYRLPYPEGQRAWVIQGNNSSFNHAGDEAFAWDFRRRCGTPVLAARAGTVSRVVDGNDGRGKGKPNNLVEVDHGDGTVGRYLHIARGSARVVVGDPVTQGQQLADVGNVGNSLTGHLHFVVERGGDSIPIAFNDTREDRGIPRTFERYRSGN